MDIIATIRMSNVIHSIEEAHKLEKSIQEVDHKIQFINTLKCILDKKLEESYERIILDICKDEDSLNYMRESKQMNSFIFHAKEILFAQVLDFNINTKSIFHGGHGEDSKIVTEVRYHAKMFLWSTNNLHLTESFNVFIDTIVTKIKKSLSSSMLVNLSKKSVFIILNKMVGNEILHEMNEEITKKIRAGEEYVKEYRIIEKSRANFIKVERENQLRILNKTFRKEISPEVINEEDILEIWRGKLIKKIMME